jgi:hypothetical protein
VLRAQCADLSVLGLNLSVTFEQLTLLHPNYLLVVAHNGAVVIEKCPLLLEFISLLLEDR